MKELDYGKNYKYAHNYEGNYVEQQFLPDEIKAKTFYEPQENPTERKIKEGMNLKRS